MICNSPGLPVPAAIKNLVLSGSIVAPTPANTANIETINKLFGFTNITILSEWKSSFVIANQVVSLESVASAASVPNFLLVLVDKPIRIDFATGAGDVSASLPIVNAMLLTIPPTTAPVSWSLDFDGTTASNANCPAVVQGNTVNYQVFACQATISQ